MNMSTQRQARERAGLWVRERKGTNGDEDLFPRLMDGSNKADLLFTPKALVCPSMLQ